jgi:hypothetical protein
MNENPEALRWEMGIIELHPHPNGIWVLYEDYERLKAELEALRRDAELGRWIREETPPIEEIAARVDGMEETD